MRPHRIAQPPPWISSLWIFFAIALMSAAPALAEDAAEPEPEVTLNWITGPAPLAVGEGIASIALPEGYIGLGAEDTQQLMALMENPVNGSEVGLVTPEAGDLSWFIVFEWDPSGWVDDSDREELDADALIESIRAGTEVGNERRRENGWATIEIVGWYEAPHYDSTTNNLTWAIEATSEGQALTNRMVKLLGRRGVMSATLVGSPDTLLTDAAAGDALLAGFAFDEGERYAEFIPGTDKIASYGLAALVAGGAGVALAQTGIFARFWKLIVGGLAVVGAGVRRIFKGRSHLEEPPNPQA